MYVRACVTLDRYTEWCGVTKSDEIRLRLNLLRRQLQPARVPARDKSRIFSARAGGRAGARAGGRQASGGARVINPAGGARRIRIANLFVGRARAGGKPAGGRYRRAAGQIRIANLFVAGQRHAGARSLGREEA